MKYCATCFYPETKPDLYFNEENICSACLAFKEREKINWKNRELEFLDLIKKIKKKKSDYDCVIPVSGGKDSTWQVLKALDYDLKPLCVNSRTCDLSNLGRYNLENIKNLGVDLIETSPNPLIRKKLNKICLLEVGDISWPEHIGIFSIPVSIAVKFQISTILWGENSQNEYGGPLNSLNNNLLDRSWLEEFGGLLGLRVSDIIDLYEFKENDLSLYKYPKKDEIEKLKLNGYFMGYFFEWDGYRNAQIAKDNGFKFYEKKVEGTSVSYENLDNLQTGIHDYFKYLKYGFGRTTDIMNNLFRRNIVSKQQALNNIAKYDGNFPHTYLGKPIDDILRKIDVSYDEFVECCDRFTNKKIFKIDNNGKPLRDKKMNLIKNVNAFS